MGRTMICKYRRAKTPFLIEQAGVHLYSLEELSWFLYHSINFVGQQMFDERLCKWLEEETGAVKLAAQIRDDIASGKDFQIPALKAAGAAGIFDGSELEALKERLAFLSSLQEQERQKLRADELLEHQNERAAMEEYLHILRMRQNSTLGTAFYAKIWNNLGVCYARQFLFEEAAECFETSCEYMPDRKVECEAKLARMLAKGQDLPKDQERRTYPDPQKKLLEWEQEYRIHG